MIVVIIGLISCISTVNAGDIIVNIVEDVVEDEYSFKTGQQLENNTTYICKIVKHAEPLIVIFPKGRFSPSKVAMNSTHIIVNDVRCSCGRLGNYEPIKEVVFKNYCSDTEKWGIIMYNPKLVAEGEFTNSLGRDYCAATGLEKWWRVRAKLDMW